MMANSQESLGNLNNSSVYKLNFNIEINLVFCFLIFYKSTKSGLIPLISWIFQFSFSFFLFFFFQPLYPSTSFSFIFMATAWSTFRFSLFFLFVVKVIVVVLVNAKNLLAAASDFRSWKPIRFCLPSVSQRSSHVKAKSLLSVWQTKRFK